MKLIDLLIPAIVGWLAGLVVNYLADVLPVTRSFSQPTCSACQQKYPWLDYFMLRKCNHCGHSRRIQAWLVQIVLLTFSFYLWIFPTKPGYILGSILIAYLGIVFMIDLRHRLILHPVSLVGAILGLGIGTQMHGIVPTLLGGIAGFGIMYFLYWLGILFNRFRVRKLAANGQAGDDEEALGGGDVFLSAVLGLVLGWPLIWFGLLLGILLAGLISLVLILGMVVTRNYGRQALMVFIPYGPYLILSAILLVYFPNWITTVVPG